MSTLTTAAALVAFPVIAGIIGGAVAVVRTPSAALVSGVQHFAAGVVMAAVATEVLPDLRARGPLWLIILGFSAGVALLVGFRQFEDHGPHGEDEDGHDDVRAGGQVPVGFLAVVAVDLFIDGLLVATGATVSRRTAIIITIALTVEVLFLGVSVALRLTRSGVPKAPGRRAHRRRQPGDRRGRRAGCAGARQRGRYRADPRAGVCGGGAVVAGRGRTARRSP